MKHVRVALGALIAVAVSATLVSCRPQPPRPRGKAPVIFVHGYAEHGDMWDVAVTTFLENGYQESDITRFEYATQGDGALNATQAAARLAERVDTVLRTSRHDRVDIVGHSLGNLVAKACIVEGGCRGKVAHWASIAGAQNGTALAAPEFCPDPACVDMRAGSELITRLQAADDAQLARQRVKVQVHWTPNDGIIVPPEGSKEPFAENIEVAATLDHFTIFVDPGVLADTVAFLADARRPRPTPGTGPRTTAPAATAPVTTAPTTSTTHGDHGH